MSKLIQVTVLFFFFFSVNEYTQFISILLMDIWVVWSWYVGYDLLVAREKSSTLELKGEYSLKIKREKKNTSEM